MMMNGKSERAILWAPTVDTQPSLRARGLDSAPAIRSGNFCFEGKSLGVLLSKELANLRSQQARVDFTISEQDFPAPPKNVSGVQYPQDFCIPIPGALPMIIFFINIHHSLSDNNCLCF